LASVTRYTEDQKHQTSPPCGILDDNSGPRLCACCTRRGSTANQRSGGRRCDGRTNLRYRCLSSAILFPPSFLLVVSSLRSSSNIQCLYRNHQSRWSESHLIKTHLFILRCRKLDGTRVVMRGDTWEWLGCGCFTSVRAMKDVGTRRRIKIGARHRGGLRAPRSQRLTN
jgi:hypothetical protein